MDNPFHIFVRNSCLNWELNALYKSRGRLSALHGLCLLDLGSIGLGMRHGSQVESTLMMTLV